MADDAAQVLARAGVLAAEGFYGIAGPREAGGLDLPLPVAGQVVETLGGTLPGPPRLRARAVPGGYRLDGSSPWVTGWGLTDTLYVAARDERDTIIWSALDVPAPTLSAEPLQLVAVMASRTVELRFDQHFVPADRVAGTLPLDDWQRRDRAGLRMNGSLALGLAARCCQLTGPGPLDDELSACRARLDAAGRDELPAARAAACELAMRAAAALVVARARPPSWPARTPSGWPGRPCSCWCSGPGLPSSRPWLGC